MRDDAYEEPVRHHWFRNLMIVLIVLLCLAGGGYLIRDKVKETVASAVGNQVIEKAAESLGIDSEQAQEILNSMSPEDKQTVTDIVSSHMDSNTISEAQKIIQDGDINEAKNFAQQELTPEEQKQLKEIAGKYVTQSDSQIDGTQQ